MEPGQTRKPNDTRFDKSREIGQIQLKSVIDFRDAEIGDEW